MKHFIARALLSSNKLKARDKMLSQNDLRRSNHGRCAIRAAAGDSEHECNIVLFHNQLPTCERRNWSKFHALWAFNTFKRLLAGGARSHSILLDKHKHESVVFNEHESVILTQWIDEQLCTECDKIRHGSTHLFSSTSAKRVSAWQRIVIISRCDICNTGDSNTARLWALSLLCFSLSMTMLKCRESQANKIWLHLGSWSINDSSSCACFATSGSADASSNLVVSSVVRIGSGSSCRYVFSRLHAVGTSSSSPWDSRLL